ncbi:hypothetical protein K456DRAFT_1709442 [Colletotrichum gloeosporioides 23]|nr:hypothetical protein K456DRAFT_1709442 [Colletotrichum gloeosporioides 23]
MHAGNRCVEKGGKEGKESARFGSRLRSFNVWDKTQHTETDSTDKQIDTLPQQVSSRKKSQKPFFFCAGTGAQVALKLRGKGFRSRQCPVRRRFTGRSSERWCLVVSEVRPAFDRRRGLSGCLSFGSLAPIDVIINRRRSLSLSTPEVRLTTRLVLLQSGLFGVGLVLLAVLVALENRLVFFIYLSLGGANQSQTACAVRLGERPGACTLDRKQAGVRSDLKIRETANVRTPEPGCRCC